MSEEIDQDWLDDAADALEQVGRLETENAQLRQDLSGVEADALRLHQEKMVFFHALLEIKCNEELTGAECMAIATQALANGQAGGPCDK